MSGANDPQQRSSTPLAPEHQVSALVPMAHVADVEKAAAFYRLLGFTIKSSHDRPDGLALWRWMTCGDANIMLTLASGPVDAGVQAVLFYVYCADVQRVREHLLAHGVYDGGAIDEHGPMKTLGEEARSGVVFAPRYPFYMPGGEVRVHDPDGYVLLIGTREE